MWDHITRSKKLIKNICFQGLLRGNETKDSWTNSVIRESDTSRVTSGFAERTEENQALFFFPLLSLFFFFPPFLFFVCSNRQ